MADKYVELAFRTIKTFIKEGRIINVNALELSKELTEKRAGTFVSVHLKNGELRGCIGTFLPTRRNIAEEIIYNAVAAASEDPRFSPIRPEELDNLEISVDILSMPEVVDSVKKLDHKKYGVIVRSGRKSGLLLPDLEGVNTVEEQISIAARKAGIDLEREKIELFKFSVERHKN